MAVVSLDVSISLVLIYPKAKKLSLQTIKYSGNKVPFYFSVPHFSVERSGQQKNAGQKNVR